MATTDPLVLADGAEVNFKRVENVHQARFAEFFLVHRKPESGNLVAEVYNTMYTTEGIPDSKDTAPEERFEGLDHDDLLALEGFQSGLSWITILRKRDNFRAAFAGFDIERVARFGAADIQRLLDDAGIIRHRGKIEATINNAQRAIELVEVEGSLVDWIWSWATRDPERDEFGNIPAVTERSIALSKELKRQGWKFVGPTTAYAFMQSEGLTNDHDDTCFVHAACESERIAFLAGRELRSSSTS